ncbi:M48 family metalloprotease [Streptomyces fulvoviolaceus]|uniref:M48 family metalloprotease n=1 Tax=Streptomyces fulvoviolaceus TaxID=285535 RepID=UPI0005B91979|nr:M48 family metallopeptidase [Streptomyces fulvoviolaceus]
MTEQAQSTTEQDCPQCGAGMPVDERYPVWCTECEWNVAPELFVYGVGGTAGLRRESAGRHGTATFEELAREGTKGHRARLTPAHVLSYALALLVHGLSFALLGVGVWLLVRGWTRPLAAALGLPMALLFLVLRPRFPRLDTSLPRLGRAEAPRLFRLVDSVAREVGTRSVDVIVVDPYVNAAVTTYGLRRRVLHLGLGLWSVLPPQEKVALLGHELGHFANGDTRHGSFVGSALHTLRLWVLVLVPERWNGRFGRLLSLLVLRGPHHLAQSALTLLEKVTRRGFPRREYLADDLAAQVASTEAARDLMETLLHAEHIDGELRRLSEEAAQGTGRADETLWQRLAEHLAAVPPRERERMRRVSALEWHQQDAGHPPTHRRIELLDRRGPSAPRIVLDARTSRAVERELRPAAQTLAQAVARGA